MSGETGQLQRLTDEQVNARLAAYNPRRFAGAATSSCCCGNVARPDRGRRSSPNSARSARHATPAIYADKVDARLGPGHRRIRPARSIASRRRVPVYIAARTQTASRIVARIVERISPTIRRQLEQCFGAFMRMSTFETDIILAQVALLEAIEAADAARPRERAVRAPRRRPGARQHRAVEGADRAHPLDRRFGPRNARQDQRSRRRRRAVGRRDARSCADCRRPHPRHRGRAFRSRSRGRRRHPRRRSGRARR